jgi:hypothetical protein
VAGERITRLSIQSNGHVGIAVGGGKKQGKCITCIAERSISYALAKVAAEPLLSRTNSRSAVYLREDYVPRFDLSVMVSAESQDLLGCWMFRFFVAWTFTETV